MKIGTLIVDIGADMSGLEKGIDKSKAKLQKFAVDARATINQIGKLGAAATAAGVAIGTVMVKEQLKAIDTLAKTSDKLGITTEALTGLRHAAELTGAGAGTLDMGLQRMTRRISEAAQGTGEAKDAIKQLGLDAQALAKLPLDQQFGKIADAMNGVQSQGERVRLTFKLFDSEGVNLVNTLALGSDGLAEMAREADELGISISRMEAAKIEAANDAITRASSAMTGVARRVTVDLAPVIEALANEFVSVAKDTDNFGATVFDVTRAILKPINWVADGIRGIQVIIKAVEVAFRGLAYGAVASFNKIGRGYVELANLIPGIDIDYDSTFLGRLEQSTADAVDAAISELHNLAMEPLPSHEIEAWVSKIQAASEEAAEAIAENRKSLTEPVESEAGGGSEGGEDAEQKRLDAMRQRFETEATLKAEHLQALADLEKLFAEEGYATDEEQKAIREELEREHMERLKEVRQRGLSDLERFNAMSWENQVSTVASQLSDMTAGISQHSRKAFEVNKIAGIANAIINTSEGVTKTLAAYPAPLSFAMAAAQAAAGLAQVNAIRSQSFSGGGGVPSPGGGRTASASATADAAPSNQGRQVIIQGLDRGSLFSGDQLASLLTELKEDGYDLDF